MVIENSERFALVVAMDEKNGIGNDGKLPWHLPSDLKHFKEITTKTEVIAKKNFVIMGRKTWESLPEKFRPLPDRINLVLSRNPKLKLPPGVLRAETFPSGLEKAQSLKEVENIFVIGGAQVFKTALEHRQCTKIFATRILDNFHCDTFFPPIPENFEQKASSAIFEENSIRFYFTEYLNKNLVFAK